MRSFGENIKQARKSLHLSQQELANLTGIAQRTISSYETGFSIPRSSKIVIKLAEVLKTTPQALATNDDRFILDVKDNFDTDAAREADELVSELTGLFAGGTMSEEDMDTLMIAVQEAYIEAKKATLTNRKRK
ncbi:helix-turn-helix domain-containing protein [Butyrivibrio sp. NC3005]|uniref:helix-turn-helix domain-containing protein n=1 Tax=Butyrivibrio sp. NC3005 TaxID=1280685 RepID=UPI0003FACE82|nr:helix-turn-helix domain-containing protein [Butyrivibrio sp. NC3005]